MKRRERPPEPEFEEVPAQFSTFAAQRIKPMVSRWAFGNFTLMELAASCYLQGIKDANEATARQKEKTK